MQRVQIRLKWKEYMLQLHHQQAFVTRCGFMFAFKQDVFEHP